MLGFGDTKGRIDSAKLSVFVHDVKSADTFSLARKVWDTNHRTVSVDQSTGKELMHFVFSNPTCIVWLQRDQNREDSFEIVLLWEGKTASDDVTEVYVVSSAADSAGAVDRLEKLLNAMLAAPSIVPATRGKV